MFWGRCTASKKSKRHKRCRLSCRAGGIAFFIKNIVKMKEVKKVKTTRYERVPGGGLRRLHDGECVEVRDTDTGAVTNYRSMDDYHASITARMRAEAEARGVTSLK